MDLGGTTFGAGRGRQVSYLIFFCFGGAKTGVGNIMGVFNLCGDKLEKRFEKEGRQIQKHFELKRKTLIYLNFLY